MCRVENKNIIKVFWAQRRHLWCLHGTLHDHTQDLWATLPQKKKASWMYVCTSAKKRQRTWTARFFPNIPRNAGGTQFWPKSMKKLAFRLGFFLTRSSSGFVPPMFPWGLVQKHWKPHLRSTTKCVAVGRSTKTCLWQIKIFKLKKANAVEQGSGQPSGQRDLGQTGPCQKEAPTKHLNFADPL